MRVNSICSQGVKPCEIATTDVKSEQTVNPHYRFFPTSRQLTGNIWHRVFRCGISRTCERLDVNYLPVLASGFENRDWSICLFCST